MRIERLKLADVNPAPYNPRIELKPSDPEWKRLEKAIDEFGMVELLVFNERTGNLVAGHQRRKILMHRGQEEADFSIVDLDLDKEKALNMALNNPNLQSKWDPHKLIAATETMDLYTLQLAGFDSTDDAHEIMRRHELQREGSFLGDFIAPTAPLNDPEPAASPAARDDDEDDDEDDDDDENADGKADESASDSASEPAAARSVETDMKEPHKHLSGEQYFEEKLVFTPDQREIYFRFLSRIKQQYGTDNTYEAVLQHCDDFNAKWDRDHIDEGAETL